MVILKKLPKNKICVDLIGPTTSKNYRPKFHIMLKPSSINPTNQKIYITHNIAMKIANFGYILCTTEYNHY